MKLTFLGTGTSTGVPQIGCNCEVCRSTDPHDKRLRCSAHVEYLGHNFLIDCGPDFRTQILREGSPDIDTLLVTHIHYDHVGGIDDLRPYCHYHNGLPVYCTADVAKGLRHNFPYCFVKHPYPGVPSFNIYEVSKEKKFNVGNIEITPLPVLHYRLPIIGYKIGNLAYITDAKQIPDYTLDIIRGIDTLVLNALRIEDHIAHLTLAEALDAVKVINPRQAFFTHISHDMGCHAKVSESLPENVFIATDSLKIQIPD